MKNGCFNITRVSCLLVLGCRGNFSAPQKKSNAGEHRKFAVIVVPIEPGNHFPCFGTTATTTATTTAAAACQINRQWRGCLKAGVRGLGGSGREGGTISFFPLVFPQSFPVHLLNPFCGKLAETFLVADGTGLSSDLGDSHRSRSIFGRIFFLPEKSASWWGLRCFQAFR